MDDNDKDTTKKPKLRPQAKDKEASRRDRGDCFPSPSTSHTQYFRRPRHDQDPVRITTDEYCKVSESLSGSSSTFSCERKKYKTLKGLQKRNFVKELDPIPIKKVWTETCPPGYGWEMANKLAFLVSDPTVLKQKERLISHLKDFTVTSSQGYRVDFLDQVCVLLNYLVEALPKNPELRESTTELFKNMYQPIILLANSDIVKHFDTIRDYIGFMGYLLLRLPDDDHFELLDKAIIRQLTAPDSKRPKGSPRLRTILAAASLVLTQTTVRMIALASKKRMPTYLKIAFILASDSANNCIELLKENIIENILYRFNPYFPHYDLSNYYINPASTTDINLKLGHTHFYINMTMSLMLMLLKTIMDYLEEHPEFDRLQFPCPDNYSQRCFVWVFRYECRARDHKHTRTTLTTIASALVHCYGDRLNIFSRLLMRDVLCLSVLTEIPAPAGWMKDVTINIGQQDVHFKKMLVYLSVQMIKVFRKNTCMITSCYWAIGLIYLIDPGLNRLRPHWSPALFVDLRKVILQALVAILPLCDNKVLNDLNLVRRIMWYIEWYSESPYDVSLLYWCMRVLHIATHENKISLKNLFDQHGIIILIDLCNTILQQKLPPMQKNQAILSVAICLLSCALPKMHYSVHCNVYPHIKWPISACTLTRRMFDVILHSLEKNLIVVENWVVCVLYFIWEAIIWNPSFRDDFILKDGIYKLLDLITMCKAPIQCIALAMISDATREGGAVGQLVTWRANIAASHAHPGLVKRGANISVLLAAIFRDDCIQNGVRLDQNGIIMDLENPIMSLEVRNAMQTPEFALLSNDRILTCYAAGDIAGSRLSKAFAILYMLSEDLHYKVSLANEAYNLYKNIELLPEDETILVLCSYYLTMKLNEVWRETEVLSKGFLMHDEEIFQEFLQIGRGWAQEIKRMQEDVFECSKNKDHNKEVTLYAFLGRVRLNVALDALRVVRCTARSADRRHITHHELLHDAVRAHHRRSVTTKKMGAAIIRTYGPTFDEQNVTGQNLKITSIIPRDKPKPRADYPPS